MKMLQLPRSKVEIGCPLPWNLHNEQGTPLLKKGHVVANDRQLDLILELGAFVDADEIKASQHETDPNPIASVVMPDTLFSLWDKTPNALQILLNDLAVPDLGSDIHQFATYLLKLLDSNPDIALYRCVRQDHAQNFWYGYSHAIHTAVLCALVARHQQWPESRLMSLVKAALTMNISILDLQGLMAAQDVPVKDKQREAIQKHPTQAIEMLQQAGIIDEDWLGAIAQHHERADGSGYPLGSTEFSEMAVALRVADIFMAKISPRTLRAPLSPQDAVRQLYGEDKGGPLSTAVIKVFGIYPPGDFVKLASGELAVVVQRTANAKAPIVASITDTSGKPVAKTVRHDTSQKEFAITSVVSDKTLILRLQPERLYGFVQAQLSNPVPSIPQGDASAPDPSSFPPPLQPAAAP